MVELLIASITPRTEKEQGRIVNALCAHLLEGGYVSPEVEMISDG
jgi:hypothetical protein